ncbi:hypothetical protein DFH29DRAFT_881333 [Suillus ampliporus]|nr:hypothetical protein DFH29DRAFT_881333 [Suillus ampliporus]
MGSWCHTPRESYNLSGTTGGVFFGSSHQTIHSAWHSILDTKVIPWSSSKNVPTNPDIKVYEVYVNYANISPTHALPFSEAAFCGGYFECPLKIKEAFKVFGKDGNG